VDLILFSWLLIPVVRELRQIHQIGGFCFMNRLAEVKPATTPLFLGVFRSEVMEKYVFKQADALTLYWFFKLALSGKMKRAPQRNSVYFWVDYGFAATQLYTNVSAIRDSFDRLCGFYRGSAINPGLLYPLSKITMPTAKGKRNYFGLNQEPMGELIYLDVFSKEECATMERSMQSRADPDRVGRAELLPLRDVPDTAAEGGAVAEVLPDLPFAVTDHEHEPGEAGLDCGRDQVFEDRAVGDRQHHLRSRCRERAHPFPLAGSEDHALHHRAASG
jgi:hypothetical protein